MKSFALSAASAAMTLCAAAQPLLCPPPPQGSSCNSWHYHVEMFQPESRRFVEFRGLNRFATPESCEQRRTSDIRSNTAVVDQIRRTKTDNQYQVDHFGPCHCDATDLPSSPTFLTETQRRNEITAAEGVRWRVREKLLASGLTTDAELVRHLLAADPPASLPFSSEMKPPPRPQPADPVETAAQLRLPRVARMPANSGLIDTPLADSPALLATVPSNATSTTAAVISPSPNPSASAEPAVTSVQVTTPTLPPVSPGPSSEPSTETRDNVTAMQTPKSATNVAVDESAAEAADRFISFETQRIQNILQVSATLADERLRSAVIDACSQRIQVLSNLRTLIEGAGSQSLLAQKAGKARLDPDRLQLIRSLFGEQIAAHWAPKDTSEIVPNVVLPPRPELLLQDPSSSTPVEARREALYALLASGPITDQQQLWLSGIVESFIR